MRRATELFEKVDLKDPEYENRVVVLAGGMPEPASSAAAGLVWYARANAERGIATTLIGLGLDLDGALVEAFGEIRGADALSVRTGDELATRLVDGLASLVTPAAFDLALQVQSDAYEVAAVYGSADADLSTGTLLRAATLFPGREGLRRVVLVKLKKKGEGDLTLRAAFLDREGKPGRVEAKVPWAEGNPNAGIRKAIALARYADLLRHWMRDAQAGSVSLVREAGLLPATEEGAMEAGGSRLVVPPGYTAMFEDFAAWVAAEKDALGEPTLERELKILRGLAAKGSAAQ